MTWVRERYQWDQGAARWYRVSTAKAPSVAVTPEAPGGVAADPPWLPAGTSQGIDPWVAAAKNPPYRCAVTYQWRYQWKLDGKTQPVFVRESWRVALSWHGGEWENPGGDTGALPQAEQTQRDYRAASDTWALIGAVIVGAFLWDATR